VLALADVVDLLAHELAGLGARGLPLALARRARSMVFFSGIVAPSYRG